MSAAGTVAAVEAGGRFFDELERGMVVDDAPVVTLTTGQAALHQAIVGGRLRLALDANLCEAVTGCPWPLADPALVCDVAIGQSTLVTQRVIANVFYRGLVLHRLPHVGESLRTTTEVVGLRQTSRGTTGLALLRVRTIDHVGRTVLDFHRCALLPLRDPGRETGHADQLSASSEELDLAPAIKAVGRWDLARFRAAVPAATAEPRAGTTWEITAGDVVSCAPELARLSLNVAAVHHDAERGARGRRLVYGGHTIGLAATQATRVLPDLLAIVAWHACEHPAPVFEGDTLTSRLELERVQSWGIDGGRLLHLRSRVRARRADGSPDAEVLDWRFVAMTA